MATIRFSNQEKLKELQARIYLEAQISLTQQQILDMSVDILTDNLDLIINRLNLGNKQIDQTKREAIFNLISDWGKNSEDSSETIDEVLYS